MNRLPALMLLALAACARPAAPPDATTAPPAPATAASTRSTTAPVGKPTTAPTPLVTVPPLSGLANPASQNCSAKGGTIALQTIGSGGQIGVCVFPDGKRCEEWALLRGACPDGGVDVSELPTPEGQYCVITGGTYVATAGSNTDQEEGSCTLPDGTVCAAAAYFAGTCGPNGTSDS